MERGSKGPDRVHQSDGRVGTEGDALDPAHLVDHHHWRDVVWKHPDLPMKATCTHYALYMCSRCGECYQCDHRRHLGRLTWKCADGVEKPAVPDREKRVWAMMSDERIAESLKYWLEERI